MKRLFLAASLIALNAGLAASPALAQATRAVERNAVEAHMNFLAGDELQGRLGDEPFGCIVADVQLVGTIVHVRFSCCAIG